MRKSESNYTKLAGSTVLAFCLTATLSVQAETLFINDATVHTMSSTGVFQQGDILIRNGKVEAVGTALTAPADATVIEAGGRPVTPGFFAGITELGLVEIGAVESSVDSGLDTEADDFGNACR